MLRYKRNLILDVYDYSGNKKCTLYDSTADMSGQATDVIVTTERNGWKELSFTIPTTCESENGGQEENFRLQYLIADYRIRLKDDEGIDWYLISEPKVTHNVFSKDVSVQAGHIAQLLKTKNLGLEFSDQEGNNVGTAAQLLAIILDGTGWNVGYVAEFKEKRGGPIKVRSMKASAKTGAFKLISNMCDLFEAKPIYHGDTKTVDIIPMNPFSEPENGQLPDISRASGCIELHYGKNVKNVTRTKNTENMVTKLYVYGAYGDATTGYCGIDEWHHKEYILTAPQAVTAGTVCKFQVPDPIAQITYTRYFKPTYNLAAGDTVLWSLLDPASMSYVWDEAHKASGHTGTAYPVTQEGSSQIVFTADAGTDVVNQVSYLMDFDYYRAVDLLTDSMVQTIAEFQRSIPQLLETANTNAAEYAEALGELSETVGSSDFCKLAASYDTEGAYLTLNLDTSYPKGVIYRTDYAVKERKQFKWRVASQIQTNGDPIPGQASIVYIIHTHTNPVTYDMGYLRAINGNLQPTDEDQDNPESVTLWINKNDYDTSHIATDHIYLFRQNSIVGDLGGMMLQDEDTAQTLEGVVANNVKGDRPVFYTSEPISGIATNFVGYGWAWIYYADNSAESEMYFCNRDDGEISWHRTYVVKEPPTSILGQSEGDYAYVWKAGALYKLIGSSWEKLENKSTQDDKFGRMVSSFGTVYNSCVDRDMFRAGHREYYAVDAAQNLPVGNYAIKDPFGDYHVFTTKAQVDQGKRISYDWENGWVAIFNEGTDPQEVDITTVIDHALNSSTYPYDAVFDGGEELLNDVIWETGNIQTGQEPVNPGSYIINGGGEIDSDTSHKRTGFIGVYPVVKYRLANSSSISYTIHFYTMENRYLGYTTGTGTNVEFTTPANTRMVRLVVDVNTDVSGVSLRSANWQNSFVVDEEEYLILGEGTGYGKLKGIIPLMGKFQEVSDLAYITKLGAVKEAQAAVKAAEDNLINTLGDIYREGYWQKADYVDGDEEKLYYDGIENLEKIAKPATTYAIQYLDLYGANTEAHEYAENDIAAGTYWPDISSDYAVHLVDPSIGVSQWAFIDKIQKCYDQPWKTTININTNLSTIAQHSFTDVMTHIAEVASEVKGKMEMYDRTKVFNDDGMMSTSTLQGVIDANTLLITGGSSTWYTDEKGNMVFTSADGKSAMTLTGNGFAIQNQKDEWGEWVWRTFGTGDGFTADLINAGTLNADRIRTGSITPIKASPDFGTYIDLTQNGAIISGAQAAQSYTDSKTSEVVQQVSTVSQEIDAVNNKFGSYVAKTEYDQDQNAITNRVTSVEQTAEGTKTTVDDYIREMGTCVDITTNGLELRQRQDSEYYAMLTSSSIDFKRRQSDESVASFGANGALIDKVRSNKVLSVGTEADGWYDMTAMPGGVADKWRDGTSTQNQLPPIITKEPEDYYMDFVSGSHPNNNDTTDWPEQFVFTLEAENVAKWRWQWRKVRKDEPWTNVSDTEYTSTPIEYENHCNNNRICYEYRCQLTGNDDSVIYSRTVRPYYKNSPIIVAQPTEEQTTSSSRIATFRFYATGSVSNIIRQFRYNQSSTGKWYAASDTVTMPEFTSTFSAGKTHYIRFMLFGQNGEVSVTNECTVTVPSS